MSFIEKTDLQKGIRLEELNQVTRSDDGLVYYGIDAAIAEIKGYLQNHFDVEKIFSKTGGARHGLLVNFSVDVAIYVILSNALPGQDLEDRYNRYKRAIKWLKGVAEGEIGTDPPKLHDDDGKTNSRGAVGGHYKRNNYY